MNVRTIRPSDRAPLAHMLRSIPQFKPEEAAIAEELIDASLRSPQTTDYECLVADDQVEGILGYVCFGPTPMTQATYDLYWIAVDPKVQGRGVGTALYEALSAKLAAHGGTQVRIETSSQESYAKTGGFYERLGFDIAGRLPDFYAPGDDLLIYYRKL